MVSFSVQTFFFKPIWGEYIKAFTLRSDHFDEPDLKMAEVRILLILNNTLKFN